jgi:hypothetical protein
MSACQGWLETRDSGAVGVWMPEESNRKAGRKLPGAGEEEAEIRTSTKAWRDSRDR